jgi:hypothetical protein
MNSDEISQPKRTRFYIKSFGTTRADFHFNKLPEIVRKAQLDLAGEDVLGGFICALDRPPRMTGCCSCGIHPICPLVYQRTRLRSYADTSEPGIASSDGRRVICSQSPIGIFKMMHWRLFTMCADWLRVTRTC